MHAYGTMVALPAAPVMMDVPAPSYYPGAAPGAGGTSEQPARCLPPGIAKDAHVVLLGLFEPGGPALPFGLSDTAYPLRRVTVSGSGKGKVILVVSAFRPTLWDFSAVRNRVKAVIASGAYAQAVTGLSPATPVRFAGSAQSTDPSDSCGRIGWADQSTKDVVRLAAAIDDEAGLRPTRFFGKHSATDFDIDTGDAAVRNPVRQEDVRAPVGIVARRAFGTASDGTSLDFEAWPQRLHIVEWDADGRITRDEGGRQHRIPPYPRTHPQWQRPKSSKAPAVGIVLTLLFALWLGRRMSKRDKEQAARDEQLAAYRDPPPAGDPAPDHIHPMQPPGQADDPATLAEMTDRESLVLALHRYGREVRATSATTLDPDLAAEAEAIVSSHFGHAAARYRQSRPSLHGPDAEHADAALQQAVERLAERLRDIRHAQHVRDVAGIDEAARFIELRHPHD